MKIFLPRSTLNHMNDPSISHSPSFTTRSAPLPLPHYPPPSKHVGATSSNHPPKAKKRSFCASRNIHPQVRDRVELFFLSENPQVCAYSLRHVFAFCVMQCMHEACRRRFLDSTPAFPVQVKNTPPPVCPTQPGGISLHSFLASLTVSASVHGAEVVLFVTY